MKKLIILVVTIFLIINGIIFYFVKGEDKIASKVDYIKINYDGEFVLGIDSNEVVKTYTALDEESNKYSITMFNNYKLDNCIDKILNNENNLLKLTVMTKNKERVDYFYSKFEEICKKYNVIIEIVDPTYNELLSFSTEVNYSIKSSLDNSDFDLINSKLILELDNYIKNKIDLLKFTKKTKNKQEILKTKFEEGYFNDFDCNVVKFENENIKIKDFNYEIIFNEDYSDYIINFDIRLEYGYSKVYTNSNYNVIEEYIYKYLNNEIIDLVNNNYKY